MDKTLWSEDGIFVDKNGDGVLDGVSLFIDLPEGLLPIGLIDFCARVGFETTALSFSFFEKNNQQVTMQFVQSSNETAATYTDGKLILTYRNEGELTQLLRSITFGDVKKTTAEANRFYSEVKSLSEIWSFSGFGTQIEASPTRILSLNITVEDAMLTTALLKELCYFAARSALYCTEIDFPVTQNNDAKISFAIVQAEQTELTLQRENAICLAGTKDNLPAALHSFVRSTHWSEGGTIGNWEQQQLLASKNEAELLFEQTWTDDSEVDRVFDCLQASSNLDDAIIEIYLSEPVNRRKELSAEWQKVFPQVQSIVVRSAFKTGFHWIKEELLHDLHEDVEKVVISVKEDVNEHALELPIRWIQEMYPIDRYIEEMTTIHSEDVTFILEGNQEPTYEVFGELRNGKKKRIGVLNVPVSRMPYVDERHAVYPSTSAVQIFQNGTLVEEQIIETDRAQFYRYYMAQILPELREAISEYNDGQGHTRPLFDRIEIDVWMSEEEAKLPVDEERISSLEALHEDLYFNTLDYFAQMGEDLEGKPFNAPGGVHPFMHVRIGEKPKARFRVYQWNDQETEKITTVKITFQQDGTLEYAYMNQGKQQIISSIECFKLPENHLHPSVSKWMKNNESYRIVYPDHSYRQHAIPVIECFAPTGERFNSALKMTLLKKTVFIEAGHHSNEVSSTPAIVELLEKSHQLLVKMNIVVIPLANPDGYELLQKLTVEHPEWKHHAARYNAVGLEFAHVRFQETVFREANVYSEILRKWAPDIIVDNHGIPSHEWVQPFAGYNSPPRFPVSYFLPSAKIYGIGRASFEVNRALHEENLEKIVQEVSSAISDTDIACENDYWKRRFVKYGQQWLPEVFPIEEAPGIHFYRQTTVTPTYSSVGILRYPEWVAADIITEAADEVVYEEALDTCIEAQTLFNRAILNLLYRAKSVPNREGAKMIRHRPIHL
ncbi:M14 family metallopeptidase [Sporosarcina limicola]|uniref:Peptidase M14 domain-containing protein n=1 Tax=Sporosarcina limicola TaxID=34101 RepID=A0A927R7I8_9BACL|nr:M14 family metallopeptidase [Sporosarcina limicola]MBE1556034.1 hypothetical protein [Sporosarcina limicola]